MSAPPETRKCRTPEGSPAPATTPIAEPQHSRPDGDSEFEKRVAQQVDWAIWEAIRRGEFKIATKCRRCGRWLTDGRSKLAHLGPRCAQAVNE